MVHRKPKMKERDIQKLYFRHPYLIDPLFADCVPLQYFKLDSGYADLVIFKEYEVYVIELKIDPLDKTHLLQLVEYVNEVKQKYPHYDVFAILVGQLSEVDLNSLIQTYSFPICIKYLIKDIPIEIKICLDCRLANDIKTEICWNCGRKIWL